MIIYNGKLVAKTINARVYVFIVMPAVEMPGR